jgi:hypothetical protein
LRIEVFESWMRKEFSMKMLEFIRFKFREIFLLSSLFLLKPTNAIQFHLLREISWIFKWKLFSTKIYLWWSNFITSHIFVCVSVICLEGFFLRIFFYFFPPATHDFLWCVTKNGIYFPRKSFMGSLQINVLEIFSRYLPQKALKFTLH